MFSYSSDGALLILFALFSAALVAMLLEFETSSSSLFLSSRKLFIQLLWCNFNPLVDFTTFFHNLHWITLLSLGDPNDIFYWMCLWVELSVNGTAHSSLMMMFGNCVDNNTFLKE